jgi:hypothetical protein
VFDSLKLDKDSQIQLVRIANSLEFIALWVARSNNIMWNPSLTSPPPMGEDGEEPELLHTTDEDMLAQRAHDYNDLMGGQNG